MTLFQQIYYKYLASYWLSFVSSFRNPEQCLSLPIDSKILHYGLPSTAIPITETSKPPTPNPKMALVTT